jgi:hypothetical protein
MPTILRAPSGEEMHRIMLCRSLPQIKSNSPLKKPTRLILLIVIHGKVSVVNRSHDECATPRCNSIVDTPTSCSSQNCAQKGAQRESTLLPQTERVKSVRG